MLLCFENSFYNLVGWLKTILGGERLDAIGAHKIGKCPTQAMGYFHSL
jgi:hypothetical protein